MLSLDHSFDSFFVRVFSNKTVDKLMCQFKIRYYNKERFCTEDNIANEGDLEVVIFLTERRQL